MAAFFLSIASLIALLVLATALCVALRSGALSRAVSSSGMGDETGDAVAQPHRPVVAGALAVSLVVLFSITLLFAVMTH